MKQIIISKVIWITSALFLISLVVHADDFTTLDGDHYPKATIKKVDPDGLLIAYPDGVVKLKFKNLPKVICDKYGYNPGLEAQYLAEQQVNDSTAYQNSVKEKGMASQPTLLPTASTNPQPSNWIPSTTTAPTSSTAASINPVTPSSQSTAPESWFQHLKFILKNFVIQLLHKYLPWAFPASPPASPPAEASASATPRPPTPQEIVNGVLGKSPIQSSELGSILDRYPALSLSALNDRPILLTGNVENIRITGLDEDIAEITLSNPTSHHIIVVVNLKKYDELYDIGNRISAFRLVGAKLFHISNSHDISAGKGSQTVVCTRQTSLPPMTFRYKCSSAISTFFDLE